MHRLRYVEGVAIRKESTVDKAESNRKNAQQSTGPRDTTATRFNAVRHGLLAKGITELDDPVAYEALKKRLTTLYRPVGDLEQFFVQRIAFNMIRLHRTGRLEAEYITAEMHPPVLGDFPGTIKRPIIDPGLPAAVDGRSAMRLASGFQRYETSLENKLYRAINQLERLQRSRKGEFVPAPESIDVSLHPGAEREA